MTGCRGICPRYKPQSKSFNRYDAENKYCGLCEKRIASIAIHCPCCGKILRTRPRSRVHKENWKKRVLAAHAAN